MSDIYERMDSDQGVFRQLLSKVPGFSGYIERSKRRTADKFLRQVIADRYEEQWKRISSLQRDLISQGEITYVDDLESAAIKIRQFIDRVRTASYGYSSFFEMVQINADDLARVYQYDLAMVNKADEIKNAIDNVEASLGTDGLPATIRNLVSLSQDCLDVFNRRSEMMIGGVVADSQ